MNKKISIILAAVLFAGAFAATAAELLLFSAADAGADVWSWGHAQIKQQEGSLLVQEKNADGMYGDVYTSDRCSYMSDGLLELDVLRVISGKFTLQVLAFHGESLIQTIDVIKNSVQAGKQTVHLGTIGLPPETDSILFKVWVADAEGAAIELKDLRYTVPFATERVLLDRKIDTSTPCSAEKASWNAGATGGGTLTLNPSETYGAVLFTEPIKKNYQGNLMVYATSVKGGVLTVQLCALDVNGAFLGSVDVIKRVPGGWHKAALGEVQWPAETDSFQVKIWLEGGEAASATINQFVILN